MPEATKTQSPSQDDSKQLKRLLESHLTVLEHKLGRAPTMEELTGFLKGAEQSDDGEGSGESQAGEPSDEPGDAEPKVLKYKVYTGMRSDGDSRVADPKKILFYETGDGRVYDTASHEWCSERPGIVDHLQSRPMMFDEQGHDIMSALVNGVLDDEDYGALDKAQMLNDHHKRVWDLNKQLQAQMGQLEKSEEPEETDESEKPPETASEEEKNDYGFEQFEGADYGFEQSAPQDQDDSGDVKGENVLEQIIRGAMAQALEAQEAKIEAMVKAAFDRHMAEFMRMVDGDDDEPQEFESFEQT